MTAVERARRAGRCPSRMNLAMDRAGTVMVEFAFLMPLALAMLFGLIEGGRLYWTKQTLDEVAYATARCMSVSGACDTAAKQRLYAVRRAADYGIAVPSEEVTVSAGAACKGDLHANRVSIDHDTASVLEGFIPLFPDRVEATACFPLVT